MFESIWENVVQFRDTMRRLFRKVSGNVAPIRIAISV